MANVGVGKEGEGINFIKHGINFLNNNLKSSMLCLKLPFSFCLLQVVSFVHAPLLK